MIDREKSKVAAFARRLGREAPALGRREGSDLEKPDPASVRSIVVWILAPLGDTIFALPALAALRAAFPRAEITGVAWNSNRDLLETSPFLDDLIVCGSSADLPRALAVVQSRPVDLSIGLSNIGSYVCAFHTGVRRVGFHAEGLRWLWDYTFSENLEGHAIDYCLSVVESLGVDVREADRHPQVVLTPGDHAWAESWLARQRWEQPPPETSLIAVHPGGSHFSAKRWPLLRFSELITRLHADPARQVVIIGGRDDRRLGEIISRHVRHPRRPWIAAGEARIRQTAALLERCDVMVGNDSGPQHLAAAVGTPVVALFGPTSPTNFRPYGDRHEVIWKGDRLACSPCFRFLGGLQQYWPRRLRPGCRLECMRSITVEDVLGAVERILGARVTAGAHHEHS